MATSKLKPVIVRCDRGSPWFGYLKSRKGREVSLMRARRIWRWYGAWTLSEIATSGLDIGKSKIAAPVDVTLTDAIEIIVCMPAAVVILEKAQWSEK